jgi:2-polyprenyl-3-methyl-5-hydroxy-6-metoxy-1,4-benzoquinol methylase
MITDQNLAYLGPWVAGLVDGEGSFTLTASNEERLSVQFVFSLGLREDDRETLEFAKRILGDVGSISTGQNQRITDAKPIVVWTVCGKREIAQVVEFFRTFPLRSKKARDFEIWSEAFNKYFAARIDANNGTPFPVALFDELKEYADLLKLERRYETWKQWKDLELSALTSPDGPAIKYVRDIFLKYGWIHRQLRQGLSILDVGCGQNLNLLYALGARIQTVPDLYVGVDLNGLSKKPKVQWADIFDNFDFVTNGKNLEQKYTPFDVAVCFEVIEHMSPADGLKMLENINFLLRPGGVLYLSTPVFNGSAAANHIHEYTIPELHKAFTNTNFAVDRRIGTFASKPDIKAVLSPAQKEVYGEMEEWFGGDVMATIMAYNHPDQSRNNLWVARKP